MPKRNISQHLVKDYWKRRVIGDRIKPPTENNNVSYAEVTGEDAINYRFLTQDDFLNEINPDAHEINSGVYSRRPIYDVVEEEKNGKKVKKWVLKGYDECEVVSLPFQYRFALAKASFFAADGFWTSNETTDHERYKKFESWKDIIGMKTAFLEAVLSCFMTGDAAIYLYQRGNTLEYTVFSYLKGDVLYPDVDENRNPVVYRQYTLKGRRAVDIYSTEYIETWVQGDPKKDADGSDVKWIDKVKGWFKSLSDGREESTDGYYLLSRVKTQLGKGVNQCVYFRINDIPSGCVQGNIEALERSLSYIAEEVKSSAFPILMLKATKMESLPPMGAHGKTIGIKGSTDDLKYGTAQYLQKQDMSNIATLNIQKVTDNIMHGSMSVFIDPEVVKQGSDSSTTMRLLFYPEEQWAQSMWPQFFPQVRQLVEVFKDLVGKIEGDVEGYGKLRVSVGQNIYLPQNETERINNEIAQANARVKSKKAAMEDIGNSHIDDDNHIWEEWEKELEIKARIPAEEKAKVEQEYGAPSEEIDVVETDDTSGEKKRIDNRMAGQSVYR